jgi:hypothetical protein
MASISLSRVSFKDRAPAQRQESYCALQHNAPHRQRLQLGLRQRSAVRTFRILVHMPVLAQWALASELGIALIPWTTDCSEVFASAIRRWIIIDLLGPVADSFWWAE